MEEPDRPGGTRCSWRSGTPRCRMVDDRSRRSQRGKGAWRSQWIDGPRQRGGSLEAGGRLKGCSNHGDAGG